MSDWQSYHDVRICVYAIAADEPEAFIDRWLDSMSGADVITILVTKADNPNYSYFLEKKSLPQFKDKLIVAEKDIKPWRFDVARNESIKLIPESGIDVCICTDIDEILIPDFWDDLRKEVFTHPNFDRIYYQYAWSHDSATGAPKWYFWYGKIHKPKGWSWRYPVHEALYCSQKEELGYSGTFYLDSQKIYLHHYPDQTKSRGSYLPLLELRAKEYPDDLYGLYYLAREYKLSNNLSKAISTAQSLYAKMLQDRTADEAATQSDILMLPAIATILGDCYMGLSMYNEAELFYKQALRFDSTFREGYIKLAQLYAYMPEHYNQCYEILAEMDQKSKYMLDWRLENWVWRNWKKYQIYADAACWEGNYVKAYKYICQASEDIKTLDDIYDAACHGFYNDMQFIRDKYENLVLESRVS